MTQCPQVRVDLKVVDLGSELMVRDDGKDQTHLLNSTARRIWELCDGTHRVDEIAAQVSRLFPEAEAEIVRRDVDAAILDLGAKGAIVWVDAD